MILQKIKLQRECERGGREREGKRERDLIFLSLSQKEAIASPMSLILRELIH